MLILFVSSTIIFVVFHRSILLCSANISLTKVITIVDRTEVLNFIHSLLILKAICVIVFGLAHTIIPRFDIFYSGFQIQLRGHYRDSDILHWKCWEMNFPTPNSFSLNLRLLTQEQICYFWAPKFSSLLSSSSLPVSYQLQNLLAYWRWGHFVADY